MDLSATEKRPAQDSTKKKHKSVITAELKNTWPEIIGSK